MPNKKISQLPGASTPLSGSEELPIVQGAVTVKATVLDITNDVPISPSQVTVGNVVINDDLSGDNVVIKSTVPSEGWIGLIGTANDGNWESSTVPVIDNAGNIYVIGTSENTSTNNEDCLITKYDAAGNRLWQKLYGASPSISNDEPGNSIAISPDGTKLAVCTYSSVFQIDLDGNILWSKVFDDNQLPNNSYFDYVSDVAIDNTGNIFAVVSISPDPAIPWPSPQRTMVLKYSSTGTLLLTHRLEITGATSYPDLIANCDGNGNLYILASSNNAYIVKLSNSLSVLWVESVTPYDDTLYDLAFDSSDNLYIITTKNSPFPASGDAVSVIKINGSTGAIIWQKALGQVIGGNDTGWPYWGLGIDIDADDNIVLFSLSDRNNLFPFNDGVWLTTLDTSGNIIQNYAINSDIEEIDQWYYYKWNGLAIKDGVAAAAGYFYQGEDIGYISATPYLSVPTPDQYGIWIIEDKTSTTVVTDPGFTVSAEAATVTVDTLPTTAQTMVGINVNVGENITQIQPPSNLTASGNIIAGGNITASGYVGAEIITGGVVFARNLRFNVGCGVCVGLNGQLQPVSGGAAVYCSFGYCSAVRSGVFSSASTYSVALGGSNNCTNGSWSGVVTGRWNCIDSYSSCFNLIGGGCYNCMPNPNCVSFIGGGSFNSIGGNFSGILGGKCNAITSLYSDTMIVGSCITADRSCATFVNNLSIKNIPTSSSGLPSGSVWSDGGVLKIVP